MEPLTELYAVAVPPKDRPASKVKVVDLRKIGLIADEPRPGLDHP
jgi:hypothetical protein